ncbi:MAG: class F sortase [Chloroflexi bacterium]|nr:class F sortase [Chloroflexota bacterium]
MEDWRATLSRWVAGPLRRLAQCRKRPGWTSGLRPTLPADWRASCNRLVAGRLWILATIGGAVAVFLITFAIVGALRGGNDAPAPADATAASAEADPPPAAPPDSGTVAPTDPVAAPAVASDSEEESAPDQAPAPAQEPGTPPEPPSEEPSETPRRNVPLPAFDESSLTMGNAGNHGAILVGPGIVESSSPGHKTDWVMLIPSARIKAALVRIGLTPSRALGAPDNPYVIGWWENGPAPGQSGNVLLAGHRDFTDKDGNQGLGVCWFLAEMQEGDFALIRDNAQEVHHLYTVTEVVSLPWNSEDGVAYLAPSPDPILTLVTCEGSFDENTHNYSNRRILVAALTDSITFEESGFEGDNGIYPGAAGSRIQRPSDEEDDGESAEQDDEAANGGEGDGRAGADAGSTDPSSGAAGGASGEGSE